MSSLTSGYSGQPTGSQDFSTRFVCITSPTYYDYVVDDIVLIPFSYSNGVLDINIQDAVYNALIGGGVPPYSQTGRMVRKMGGTGLVQSIGPYFQVYLKNLLAYHFSPPTVASDITGIQVYTPATVTKVQQPAKQAFNPHDGSPSSILDASGPLSQYSAFYQSDVPPASDGYLYTGSPDDNWGTAWVFQTPLTIKYFADGLPKYITFTTTFTKNLDINLIQCFPADSRVHLADGTVSNIQDVEIGQKVVGAFGEINTVLALHRPLLHQMKMCRINNEHSSVYNHPHVTLDSKFVSLNPESLKEAYGKEHVTIDVSGETKRLLKGIKGERIQTLELGTELKTIDGSRAVKVLDMYELPPETQLYNLVVDGSHTYHVNGYAVTGWPNEDDFDYDTWKQK